MFSIHSEYIISNYHYYFLLPTLMGNKHFKWVMVKCFFKRKQVSHFNYIQNGKMVRCVFQVPFLESYYSFNSAVWEREAGGEG